MFEFKIADPGPISVKIDGVEHLVPRLLLPEMDRWMEELTDRQIEKATGHLDEERRAQFLLYHQPPLFDVADVAVEVRTPGGVKRLLERMLPKATPPVPKEKIDQMIKWLDPRSLRQLADYIASAATASAIIRQRTESKGDKSDPLAKRRKDSAGSRSTGSKSKSKSSALTPPSDSPNIHSTVT